MGYLAIQSFGANTAADTAQALQALLESGPSGFILDLRGNTGGLVSAGVPLSEIYPGSCSKSWHTG